MCFSSLDIVFQHLAQFSILHDFIIQNLRKQKSEMLKGEDVLNFFKSLFNFVREIRQLSLESL